MFATLYLPNFYLQAAVRHQPELREQAAGVIDDRETKPVIIQLNQAAEGAGVCPGMTSSQGLARHLPLVIKTRLHRQEELLADLLLQFAFTLAPYVEATAAGVCTVQFTDTRDVLRKVQGVVDQLGEAGTAAQAGIAPTPDASLLAAHLARPVLQADNTRDFLAPLPIETLLVA